MGFSFMRYLIGICTLKLPSNRKKTFPFVAFSGFNLFTQRSCFMVKEEEPFGVLVSPHSLALILSYILCSFLSLIYYIIFFSCTVTKFIKTKYTSLQELSFPDQRSTDF